MAERAWNREEEVVCVCHEVKRSTIRRLAAEYGAFDEIVQRSEICQTCQGCESEIRAIIAEVRAARGRSR